MLAALRQTLRYFKRNGFSDTLLAVRERLWDKKHNKYSYTAPSQEELNRERGTRYERGLRFSVVVPAFETPEVFLQDLILSIVEQSYTDWELIIADASESNAVARVVKSFQEQYGGIKYLKLNENVGISENTNRGIEAAEGAYIALLDHDDLLTPDALYRARFAIDRADQPVLLYSDEDKCDRDLLKYFEPHIKRDFDEELLYTNNYICHLSVYRADVLKALKLDKAYDGSQDHELVLRCMEYCKNEYGSEWRKKIVHIPYVLYHWRSHEDSTAADPAHKTYAFEAGRRAVAESFKRRGIEAKLSDLKHLGFYRVDYTGGVFAQRKDIGAVAGPVFLKGRLRGGAMDDTGNALYSHLPAGFSGPMHIAALQQSVDTADLRNMAVKEELIPLYKKITGYAYPFRGDKDEKRIIGRSLAFCKALREEGYSILYDPQFKSSEVPNAEA